MPNEVFGGFAWQDQAVEAWLDASGQGIVVGMTGTGKTHVGLKAIQSLLDRDKRVSPLIVVPTTALLDQWIARLQSAFPGKRFGRLGDGSHDDFSRATGGALPFAIVSTIHSAVTAIERGLFDHCDKGGDASMVVADECHRYSNEDQKLFNRLLRRPYSYILGLSATMERFEAQGLGKIVYEYDINRAVREGVIPAFDVLNVGVDFTSQERQEYLGLSKRIGEALQRLFSEYPNLEYVADKAKFWSQVRRLAAEDNSAALAFQGNLFKRAALAHEASAKRKLIPKLIELAVNQGERKALVFFERIWTSDEAQMSVEERFANTIRAEVQTEANAAGGPLWCEVYHSRLRAGQREDILDRFRKQGPSALLACRSLDEGLDVPDVDVGILVASTQSARQRLQRIGRTLRRGEDKKKPLIIITYVNGVSDSDVAIQPQDEKFAEAATVHDAKQDDALPMLASLLGIAGYSASTAKPSEVSSPARVDRVVSTPPPVGTDDTHAWLELTLARTNRASMLSKLRMGTPLKVELQSGKLVRGCFRGVVGLDLMLQSPPGTCGIEHVKRIWQGTAQR